MKKRFCTIFLYLYAISTFAQQLPKYAALDTSDPVGFLGHSIIYKGDTINLGAKAFFIDGNLDASEANKYPFVFNSINEACQHLSQGSEQEPMVLYIAPYVYWIDNPDNADIRVSTNSEPPYGLEIACDWLTFYGLTDDARNVVMACNRGQTIGAEGNFTMFKITGDGTRSENVTFGNYCNVDLRFPLKPELNRDKRAEAIVQAQLILCNGDKIVARNTRFVSRLNLCPFVGGKRVLFDRCHFECTDDALCGTGVYYQSTFDFYSSKPFYNTVGTGAVLLNCSIQSLTKGEQYFTKANGQLAIIDSQFHSRSVTYWGWQNVPPHEMRNYQANVLCNGKHFTIGERNAFSTVDITNKRALNAYRFSLDGKVIYNFYNLLRGNDGWEPMGMKDLVVQKEQLTNGDYSNLPVQIKVTATNNTIETDKDSTLLSADLFRFGNYKVLGDTVYWHVSPEFAPFVKLLPKKNSCVVVATNTSNESKSIVVVAKSASGLEAASVITVLPHILPAPLFTVAPKIKKVHHGALTLDYQLDTDFEDHSLVSWYRCENMKGDVPVEVAVSRNNTPLMKYELTAGDIGKYIMVKISPKHIRSLTGQAVKYVYPSVITASDVLATFKRLSTNFKSVSVKNQNKIVPGYWTFRDFETPEDDKRYNPERSNKEAWYYGAGSNGAAGKVGLLQTGRNASLYFKPVGDVFSDMKVQLSVTPFKSAGQGFSVAGMYMDVLVKYDAELRSGYGLRFIRTTKIQNTVECFFVRYDKGFIIQLSEPVTTCCFKGDYSIELEVKDSVFVAKAQKCSKHEECAPSENVVSKIYLETTIDPSLEGGFGIRYNGGAKTMINEIKLEWK